VKFDLLYLVGVLKSRVERQAEAVNAALGLEALAEWTAPSFDAVQSWFLHEPADTTSRLNVQVDR